MKIKQFEDIEAWQLARVLTRKIYDLTRKEKFARDFGLKTQIQEAAGSSMHNIAEGFDSGTNVEFMRFLRYAKRSCTEVQSELYLALDLEYISTAEFATPTNTRATPAPQLVASSNTCRPVHESNRKEVKDPAPPNREPSNPSTV